MKETISLEITPRELELLLDAINTAQVKLHDKILDKRGKVITDNYYYTMWQELGELWGKCYDLEQKNESVVVWK